MPRSIYEINGMPEPERRALLSLLIPRRLFDRFSIDPSTLRNPAGVECVRLTCPGEMPFFQIDVRRDPGDRDDSYFLDVSNSPFGQMEISFIIVNDPDGERYGIDRDEHGHETYFGTARRNIPVETRAMEAAWTLHRSSGGDQRRPRGSCSGHDQNLST